MPGPNPPVQEVVGLVGDVAEARRGGDLSVDAKGRKGQVVDGGGLRWASAG